MQSKADPGRGTLEVGNQGIDHHLVGKADRMLVIDPMTYGVAVNRKDLCCSGIRDFFSCQQDPEFFCRHGRRLGFDVE